MNKSFKLKAAIIIIGTVILGNLILSFSTYEFITSKIESDIINDMEDSKRVSQNFLAINDDYDLEGLARSLYLINKSYCGIYNGNEENIAFGGIHSDEKIKEIVEQSQNKQSILNLNKEASKYIATFSYPLYDNKEYIATLIVQSNYGDLYKENMSLFYILLLCQSLIIIVLAIVIWVILSKITKPIVVVSDAMRNFGKTQKQEDLKVVGEDEIATITSSFNLMKNQIIKEKEMSREFFNNATHELKTPVTAISGYAELLLEEGDDCDKEFRDRALSRMKLESAKLNRLIKNILEISRGSIKIQENKEQVNLNKVICKIIDDLDVRIKKSNLTITQNISDVDCELVKKDIELVLLNLIDNSVKYSKGSEINIELYKNDDITFIIRNSIGYIEENIKDNLFDPFIKSSNEVKLDEMSMSSSGLGLYICLEVCTRNGWDISYTIEGNLIEFILKI